MLSVNHARGLARDVMEAATAACLTTVDEKGYPVTRAMLNLRNRKQYPCLGRLFDSHEEDFLVYFTTNTSSTKVAQIAQNPKASVYYCLPESWRGLNLIGTMQCVEDSELKETFWQRNWEIYYPEGPADPDYTILMFMPTHARYYHQLERAEWDFPTKSGSPMV